MKKDIIASFNVQECRNGKGVLHITNEQIIFVKDNEGTTLNEELKFISHLSSTKTRLFGYWLLNITIAKNGKKINLEFKMNKTENIMAESEIRNAMRYVKKNVQKKHEKIPLTIPQENIFNDCWHDVQNHVFISLNSQLIKAQRALKPEHEKICSLLGINAIVKDEDVIYFKYGLPCVEAITESRRNLYVILPTILDSQLNKDMVNEMFCKRTLFYTTKSPRHKIESYTNIFDEFTEIEYQFLCEIKNIQYKNITARQMDYEILQKYQDWNNTLFAQNNFEINKNVISSMHKKINPVLLKLVYDELDMMQKRINPSNLTLEESRLIKIIDTDFGKIALGYEYQHPRLFENLQDMKLQLNYLADYKSCLYDHTLRYTDMPQIQYLNYIITSCCRMLALGLKIDKKYAQIKELGTILNIPKTVPLEIDLSLKYKTSLTLC